MLVPRLGALRVCTSQLSYPAVLEGMPRMLFTEVAVLALALPPLIAWSPVRAKPTDSACTTSWGSGRVGEPASWGAGPGLGGVAAWSPPSAGLPLAPAPPLDPVSLRWAGQGMVDPEGTQDVHLACASLGCCSPHPLVSP